jgi:hypothetical protein
MRLERGVQATGVAPHSSTLQFRSLDVKATKRENVGLCESLAEVVVDPQALSRIS